ncbi:His/Gly/Thr/Pro-type tRNA ligase C-terminal domain-containing protein [Paenibacillus aceris]|uniref:Histidyl-tRNA synthetase n=1 Tax=Paenibacillus aceris TaxID=869555 RepID=A0ABS4HT58_9BACL|nr:His/Gly/Thr/Pro-type tRNA ligase C-terminal domain-containing protein [Paenibacillus aceris]MBP1961700.1 histidyl-tRNA synthetase [Paenibacillus aceris]NHW34441.1 hypothetical protein [Paenibacillus aceris]
MENANQWYVSSDERYVNHLEQARVILLAPITSRKAVKMSSELNQVGIGVRTESVNPKFGLQMAAELGIRFVIGIHENEIAVDQVSLMDMLEMQERIMPMDQAIYVIEKIYPPADFT